MDSRRFSYSVVVAAVTLVGLLALSCAVEEPIVDNGEPPATHSVDVYFTNTEMGEIGEVFAVSRVTTEEDLALAALTALLAGPTESEEADGYSSWFSTATADMLVSLEVEDGVARVDFDPELRDVIPGASSSAGSMALLAELDTTLTQFAEIDSTLYSLGGDVDAFYEWLQRSRPDGS